jgi:hypothetical protein
MGKQKFKKGDNIIVTKGMHKGMRGTISCIFGGSSRIRYQVTFKSFKVLMYSYEMSLDVVEKPKTFKRTVDFTSEPEKSPLKPGMHVILSKQGLAKVYIDGICNTGHSYEWVRDHNFHTIDQVSRVDGINFYTLVGFSSAYHFTEADLFHPKYGVGDNVRFTRESLVKLGIELSQYYGDDTIKKLPQNIIGPRKVMSICHQDGKVLYQLDGECFGKFFFEHEIESTND